MPLRNASTVNIEPINQEVYWAEEPPLSPNSSLAVTTTWQRSSVEMVPSTTMITIPSFPELEQSSQDDSRFSVMQTQDRTPFSGSIKQVPSTLRNRQEVSRNNSWPENLEGIAGIISAIDQELRTYDHLEGLLKSETKVIKLAFAHPLAIYHGGLEEPMHRYNHDMIEMRKSKEATIANIFFLLERWERDSCSPLQRSQEQLLSQWHNQESPYKIQIAQLHQKIQRIRTPHSSYPTLQTEYEQSLNSDERKKLFYLGCFFYQAVSHYEKSIDYLSGLLAPTTSHPNSDEALATLYHGIANYYAHQVRKYEYELEFRIDSTPLSQPSIQIDVTNEPYLQSLDMRAHDLRQEALKANHTAMYHWPQEIRDSYLTNILDQFELAADEIERNRPAHSQAHTTIARGLLKVAQLYQDQRSLIERIQPLRPTLSETSQEEVGTPKFWSQVYREIINNYQAAHKLSYQGEGERGKVQVILKAALSLEKILPYQNQAITPLLQLVLFCYKEASFSYLIKTQGKNPSYWLEAAQKALEYKEAQEQLSAWEETRLQADAVAEYNTLRQESRRLLKEYYRSRSLAEPSNSWFNNCTIT